MRRSFVNYGILILFALSARLNAAVPTPRECVQLIVDEIVKPLLIEGRAGDRVSYSTNLNSNTVIVRSPRGSYEFRVVPTTSEGDLGNTVAPIRRNANGNLEGFLALRPDWLSPLRLQQPQHRETLLGMARTLPRGDEWWNAHIPHPGDAPGVFLPSNLQVATLGQLKRARRTHRAQLIQQRRKNPSRAMLILPGGLGKTVISMMDAVQFFGGNPLVMPKVPAPRVPADGVVIVTVQDVDILSGFLQKMEPYLNLDRSQIAIRFGSRKTEITQSTRLILATRTGFMSDFDDIFNYVKPRRGPGKRVYGILDEAHDAALEHSDGNAEFQLIIDGLNTRLTREDFILFQSATPWHRTSQMLTSRRLVDGSIVAPMATPLELQSLAAGKDVERLGLEMMMLAGYRGMSAPWRFLKTSLVLNNNTHQLFPLEDRKPEDKDKDEDEDEDEEDTRKVVVNTNLIDAVARDILEYQQPGLGGRVIVFARAVKKCDVLAEELQKALQRLQRERGATQDLALVNSYHGRTPAGQNRVGWLSDVNTPGIRVLVVDRKFRQGTDAPATDMAVILREIDLEDAHDVRSTVQAIMRASRLSPGKTGYNILDYTGQVRGLTNLPESVDIQQSSGGESTDGEGRDITVEDLPFERVSEDAEITPLQANRQGEYERIVNAYAGKSPEEIIHAAAGFHEANLSAEIAQMILALRKINVSALQKRKLAQQDVWGRVLLANMESLLDWYRQMEERAKGVAETAEYLRDSSELTQRDLLAFAADVRAEEMTIRELWNSIFTIVRELDPYREASVRITFRPPRDQKRAYSQISARTMREFYRKTLQELRDERIIPVPQEILADDERTYTLVLKGQNAYGLFIGENNVTSRVYRTASAHRGDNKMTRTVEVLAEPLEAGSFPFESRHLIRSATEESIGVTLDLDAEIFRLPGKIAGQINAGREQNYAYPNKREDVQLVWEHRLVASLQHYLYLILSGTVNAKISTIAK